MTEMRQRTRIADLVAREEGLPELADSFARSVEEVVERDYAICNGCETEIQAGGTVAFRPGPGEMDAYCSPACAQHHGHVGTFGDFLERMGWVLLPKNPDGGLFDWTWTKVRQASDPDKDGFLEPVAVEGDNTWTHDRAHAEMLAARVADLLPVRTTECEMSTI